MIYFHFLACLYVITCSVMTVLETYQYTSLYLAQSSIGNRVQGKIGFVCNKISLFKAPERSFYNSLCRSVCQSVCRSKKCQKVVKSVKKCQKKLSNRCHKCQKLSKSCQIVVKRLSFGQKHIKSVKICQNVKISKNEVDE